MKIPQSIIDKYNFFIFDIKNEIELTALFFYFNNYDLFDDDETALLNMKKIFNEGNGYDDKYISICIDPDSEYVIYKLNKKWWDSNKYKEDQFVRNGIYRFYPQLFTIDDLKKVDLIINGKIKKQLNISNMYKRRKFVIEKFDEFDNLEYRKGSNEFGGLVTKVLEYLRLIRKDEKKLVFDLNDFQKNSNITKEELESLIKAKEDGKNLFDFTIVIDGDKVIFSGFDSGKTRPFESITSIRNEYEKFGIDDFYKFKGNEYVNPHLKDIEKSIKIIVDNDCVDLSNILDLAAGTGEVTNILNELGYQNVEATDPYLYNEYENNTGNKCMKYSFEDIQKGSLKNKKYSTIICSYALHLSDKSILHDLLWELSMISEYLVIISPNKNLNVSDESWELIDNFTEGKSKIYIYYSKN